MVFKKILKGALHVSTGGTTYLAEKGYKAIKKKLENVNTEKLAKKKQNQLELKRKKLELVAKKRKQEQELKRKKLELEAKKRKQDKIEIQKLLNKELSVKKIIKKGFEKDLVLDVKENLDKKIADEKYRLAEKDKNQLKNELLEIPGINEKLANYISKQYKSVDKIKKVSLEELLEVPELSKKQAGAIKKL